MPPTLYLIDGHALAYRTYFALTSSPSTHFTTRAGEPTAGIYGFASVMIRILEQNRPDYLAVAFDTGKTFRDDIYPAYKATRAKMPDDLRPQIERIRQLVDAFGFPRLEMEGFEADDVLGSVAHLAVEKGLAVKIVTGDRDLLQLVNDHIIVNLAGKSLSEAKDYFERDVKEYLGVWPRQVVDYKALVGDKSDNIPGVQGIGEKTAVGLFETYPTLDDIYEHLDVLPARVKSRLETDRANAEMSRKLASIRTDLDIQLDLSRAKTDHIPFELVEKFFVEMEFRSLQNRLKVLSGGAAAAQPVRQAQLAFFDETPRVIGENPRPLVKTIIVRDTAGLQALCEALRASEWLALDTETTSTDPMRADLVGISLSNQAGLGYYIPVGHRDNTPQLFLSDIQTKLGPILIDPKISKVGHNLKYDLLILRRHGLPVEPISYDTMVAAWLVDPASHRLGLKDLADDLLNVQMTHIEELIGTGKNQRSMAEVSSEKAADYAAADAEVTYRLRETMLPLLAERQSTRLMEEIEMPLLPVLADMEQTGIGLDTAFLKGLSRELTERLASLEEQVHQGVGHPFNLNSTQQLSTALFTTLKLEPPDKRKTTASGHFSTSADVLELLRGKHPVVDQILEHRELSKLLSTYIEALPLQVNPRTRRVHTSYNQTGSVTGRLASSEPNLQNIPTRTELGRKIRRAFVADPGWLLLSIDYSQIELRIVAHMANDTAMLGAFRAGQDIHAATAAAIYNIPLSEVTREQRRHAKAINFGLIYGMSAFGLSRSTDLTLAEAENFVAAYFKQFPGVKTYLDGLRRQAASQGYVETMLGRRRYFPNLRNQMNPNLRNREEREAINAPIQGTAADIMKLAMIRVPPALKAENLQSRLLLQVHDELVLECPENELLSTGKVVMHVMELAYPLSIPLLTEAKWGRNWEEMLPISEYK
ncbi:MAG: DNA polymerase I [Leptolinea sp.]|jgi:DNA polymerase-1|nr:DNA polymerase I [Leptolinea sp.]